MIVIKRWFMVFPGSLVVETLCLQCRGLGFNPWLGEVRSHILGGAEKENMACYLQVPKRRVCTSRAGVCGVAREKAPGLVRRQKEREKTGFRREVQARQSKRA